MGNIATSLSSAAMQASERALARKESLVIARRLKKQDAGLLDELIVQYQHRLMRYLLYLTRSQDLAEDLFQEVWMRVLVRGAQFDGKSRFDTWLFTIARNLVIDFRRKRTMASLDAFFDSVGEEERPVGMDVADQGLSPFELCAGQQDRDRIAAVLLEMDALYREVLVLRFHEEMALEEIAKVTGSPLSTVKSRLYRGLAAMKPKLAMQMGAQTA